MPLYDFRCKEHGDIEVQCKIAEREEQSCSECGELMTQFISKAPSLDETAMSYMGMPGAAFKHGARLHKQHRSVDQSHRKAS
jgi:putative FmdB family regulatory protein